MEPRELAAALTGLLEWAHEHAPRPEPALRRRLREHLGTDPAPLEVLVEEMTRYDHVNFQVALDALEEEREVIGLGLEEGYEVSLAALASSEYDRLRPGPVQYVPVDVGDRTISCLSSGLVLTADGTAPLVALLSPAERHASEGLVLQVMALDRATAEGWLRRVRSLMRERNVYRGKVVEFGGGEHPFRPAPVSVRRLPEVGREQIVLPAAALERIERHTAGMALHRDALRASGRHVRRGLLLHGPPGTGKTLTLMYLAALMPERTVVLVTGTALGSIGPACQLARSLEPAMVAVEDVDLIAQDRRRHIATPLMFELLNAMDGLDEDADVIFALTTNRPEVLEPALAARPGRVDLAVELPLPDADARRRLLALYAAGLDLEGDLEPVVAATDGVAPVFVRELLRQAALMAAEAGTRVDGALLLRAVDELKRDRGRMTAALLGAERPRSAPDDEDEDEDDDGPGFVAIR